MKKLIVIISLVFCSGLVFGIAGNSFAESNELIPSWIKSTAKFWVNDQISDQEFLNALQFLVSNGMLTIPEANDSKIIQKSSEIEFVETGIFPDPNKKPEYYLKRYYTESSYKDWFDKNYPDTTIEEKVGYHSKIVTDDYYVNSFFEFAIKPPKNWIIQENPVTTDPEFAGIVSFFMNGEYAVEEYNTSMIIHYLKELSVNQIQQYNSNLLEYHRDVIYFEESSQTKLKDEYLTKKPWGYILHYKFNDVSHFPEEVIDGVVYPEVFLTLQNEYVIFLFENGERYDIILTSMPRDYSKASEEFSKSIKTFHVGSVQTIDEILQN